MHVKIDLSLCLSLPQPRERCAPLVAVQSAPPAKPPTLLTGMAQPVRVRPQTISPSNSATLASICIIAPPVGFVVSMA